MPTTTTRSAIRASSMMLMAVALAACGGGSGGGSAPRAQVEHALAQFADCDDLRSAIVADAREKITLQAQRLRDAGFVPTLPIATFPAAAPTPAGAPQAPGATPRDFTDTNTQVPGVDEADVVETDGTHLYLLRGAELVILDAWPPETTALRARVTIEGWPVGMFVAGGRALVVSSVFDSGALGGTDACHVLGAPLPAFNGSIVDTPCGTSFTKLTVLDLASAEPRVAREIYLEGVYVAARRHGNLARVVVQRGWGLPPSVPEPWSVIAVGGGPGTLEEHVRRVDDWEQRALAAVQAAPLAAWLPARLDRVNGMLVTAPPECGGVHMPPPAVTADGTTRVFAFDIRDDAGAVGDTIVMGGAATAFSSADTLVLGQPDWSWLERGEPNDRTALHVFTLPPDSAETIYRASGFVAGVPPSQFAFEVQDDVIRVATTVRAPTSTSSIGSRVTTLQVTDGTVQAVGATEDLAPGEQLFGVRFLGSRAYLVTFRRIDPLFVVDLADPAHPRVLGQVDLPGFSQYLHPLDDHHLITIGVDADAFGALHGLALRLFDIVDPTMPKLTDAKLLAATAFSPAQSNHLAFTFDARPGLLAIPYSRFDEAPKSSLVLVTVDASAGFTVRGEIDHQSLATDVCPGSPGGPCLPLVEMERGLFIDDWIYSISSAGVRVNAVDDLAPVATVPLPGAPSPPGPVPPPRPGPS